ncbi:DNA glycosylase AlkZ-like family protein [Isoptericola halotolerans]|uniref:Winged helix DNA-binding domain-containing protein n=1 Tax=Isoptericola halotolerans TaxID=300560 RepID=A0ABX2AAA8_9MICO|nr:hypothetical protein [Isoptericola halotolerans]
MTTQVTLEELNRTTLARQHLLERAAGSVAAVVGDVGGLQAQHPEMPFTALWSRRSGPVTDLSSALTDRSVVRATVMRSTLHLVPATRWADLDVTSAAERLATWRPSARRAGVDLVELNAAVREHCRHVPRTVDEIEAFAATRHPGVDASAAVPAGVRRAWWRLASAGGGLVQVPPTSMHESRGPASYAEGSTWCDLTDDSADVDRARVHVVVGYLRAFGPAARADIAHGLGIRRATPLKAALAEIGPRVLRGPGGVELLDVPDGEVVGAGTPAPVRFLPRWEHLLVALKDRARLLDDAGRAAVYRRNGDVLPTWWVGGRVAGTWSVERAGDRAELALSTADGVGPVPRDEVEAEGRSLLTSLVDDASELTVRWG